MSKGDRCAIMASNEYPLYHIRHWERKGAYSLSHLPRRMTRFSSPLL